MFTKNMFNIRDEEGYSLLGFLMALAITAMLTAGIMTSIYLIFNVSSDRTNQIIAIREVQNTGGWFTLDGQKAVTITKTADSDGFPLTIKWDDPDDNQHEVVYTLLPDKKLQRQHYTNRIQNPNPDATTVLASHIDLSNTSCNVTVNNELVAMVTAAVIFDQVTYTETRTYRIFPRRSLR